MSQRDLRGVREWYRTHRTTAQLGYNPNGMCLKICREARNIGAMHASALSAQLATPKEHRIFDVARIKPGHVLYFDDPDDDNPFGHIVTCTGLVKGGDPDSLSSKLVRTNSVKSGLVLVTKADYFGKFWTDPFVFGSDWLNGQELIMPSKPKPQPALPDGRVNRLRHAVEIVSDLIDKTRADPDLREGQKLRLIKALRRDRVELLETIEKFGREDRENQRLARDLGRG